MSEINDPNITRTMSLEEVKEGYRGIVLSCQNLLLSLANKKGRIVAGIAALCSIFGISVSYLLDKMVQYIKWIISILKAEGVFSF